MALPRIRHLGGRTFVLPGGDQIYVTNKFSILSGPEEWLAPIGLSSLRLAMEDAADETTNSLYVSTDPPDRFDDRYPAHLLDVRIDYSDIEGRVSVVVGHERRNPDEDAAALRAELAQLCAGPMRRHAGSRFAVERNLDAPEYVEVGFDIPTRGRTVADALAIGKEIEALLEATAGGALTLTTTVDLIRSGHAKVLVGQVEGPWFDGKGAPYRLTTHEEKWELAKDVAAFANSEAGGALLIGARTKKYRGGDVVQSVTDVPLNLIDTGQYRKTLIARVHPRVEGLEIVTVDHGGGKGVGLIHIPPQREEIKPFVVKGVVTSGGYRGSHVSIPVRDGEETRYADPAEVHSLLQAGRVALRERG